MLRETKSIQKIAELRKTKNRLLNQMKAMKGVYAGDNIKEVDIILKSFMRQCLVNVKYGGEL